MVGEGEFEAEGGGESFEDAPASGDDFAAYAVAGDEACSAFSRSNRDDLSGG